MLDHSRTYRFSRAIASLLALGVLVLISAVWAAPASALGRCPTTGLLNIARWETMFSQRGVTMCRGMEPAGRAPSAFVQIVELTDDAKVRIISQQNCCAGLRPGDFTFTKRTVTGWRDWIVAGGNTVPATTRLFSVVNASFFTRFEGGSSPLSLPETSRGSIRTYGWAFEHDDLADPVPKRRLTIGSPDRIPQEVNIGFFPTTYSAADVQGYMGGIYDGIVGFEPLSGFRPEHRARRTTVGWRGSQIYILTSNAHYTLREAQAILNHFGSLSSIQLDGGGSTQMWSPNAFLPSCASITCQERAVPDVLAVYTASVP